MRIYRTETTLNAEIAVTSVSVLGARNTIEEDSTEQTEKEENA